MRRERSNSSINNKSINKAVLNGKAKQKTPGQKVDSMVSPSPSRKMKFSAMNPQPLVSSRSKPRAVIEPSATSAKRRQSSNSLQANKQNSAKVSNPQAKNRTIKNMRLQNTKKDSSISKPSSTFHKTTFPSHKGTETEKKINIKVTSPIEKSKNLDDTLLLQEQPILKYVPPFNPPKRHSIFDFKMLRTITQETYFRDVLAFHQPTQCLFTLRIVSKQDVVFLEKGQQLTQALKLQFYLNKLHLPHLQTLYGIIEDPCDIYFILQPLVPSLEEKTIDDRHPDLSLSILTRNILETLQEVHKERIMFRKLQSKFIRNHLGLLKIGLLDSATNLSKKKRRSSFLGSLQTIPHQLAQGLPYNESCDLWSLGLLLYQISTGMQPFSGTNMLEKIQELDYDMPMHISSDFSDFLNKLLTEETNRLTIEQALEHPFVVRSEKERSLIPRDLWVFWELS